MMAQHSESDAKQLGDSHERSSLGPYKETYMDLYNNRAGRQIGAANSTATHEELRKLVGDALREGKLITNLENIPDVFSK